MRSIFFTAGAATTALVLSFGVGARAQDVPAKTAVVTLVEKAVAERIGAGATVTAAVIGDVPAGAFVSATPDPMGRLGHEINFTLVTAGAASRPVRVRARVDVIASRVQAVAPILRGHVVAASDVERVGGPLVDVPVKRLPELSQIVGQAALRPIERGQVIESSFVALRHIVQAGDTVTVVAIVGAVQVTAQFVAADSGDPGDIVRVVNHETHRSIRARVVNKGVVEVINER